MSECTHDCSSCSENCAERDPKSFLEPLHELSRVRKVIAVVSGKGGVGKSLVTSMLAALMQRRGHQAAILDADVTGPSIPQIFGVHERATGSDTAIFPVKTTGGIQMMSLNLLLENETDPVVWRGPVIAGTVKQFWSQVIWSDVDYMFVDMPPGTGDVPLTVFQSIPVDGIVIVTSPQELVTMVVEKAVKMAGMMHIPVIGLVENMAYFECPSCGERHAIYGTSHAPELAARYDIPCVSALPIAPQLAALCDEGAIERFSGDWLDGLASAIEALPDAAEE